jgi:hypothetical protein
MNGHGGTRIDLDRVLYLDVAAGALHGARALPAALVIVGATAFSAESRADEAPAAGSDGATERPAATAVNLPTRPAPTSLRLAPPLRDRGADMALVLRGGSALSSAEALPLAPRRDGGFAPRLSPAQAFTLELREESLRYLDRSPWSDPLGDVEADDHVRRGRERVAERVLADAAEAALDVALRGVDRHSQAQAAKTGRSLGLRLAGTPTWSVARRAGGSSLRFDVPLWTSALRFHATRVLPSEPWGIERVQAGVAVDPFDESVRFSIRLGF